MSEYTPTMPHGELEEIFPDIYFVTGTTRPIYQGVEWQFSRNMTVVRDGAALTLINTVRLDDAGLAALDRLGKVENVVKLGSFHGIDDAFYLDRYGATLWALPGMTHERGHVTQRELRAGGDMPLPGCSLFVFETSSAPEGLLLIEREGGILVACDSLQNWAEPDRFFSDESAALMREFGFFRTGNIGPGWRQACNPQQSDFDKVAALPFQHLLSAHGTPLRDTAHQALTATFAELFPSA